MDYQAGNCILKTALPRVELTTSALQIRKVLGIPIDAPNIILATMAVDKLLSTFCG